MDVPLSCIPDPVKILLAGNRKKRNQGEPRINPNQGTPFVAAGTTWNIGLVTSRFDRYSRAQDCMFILNSAVGAMLP